MTEISEIVKELRHHERDYPELVHGPLCGQAADIITRLSERTAQAEKLAEFFKWAMRDGPWDGGDLDGGAVQDKAESLGLIVKTPYDPEVHGLQSDFETGDDFFVFAPFLRVVSGSGDAS